MRVALLNMTDSSEKYPDGFRLYSENGIQACGQPFSSGNSSVRKAFPSDNIEYSQLCGKVVSRKACTSSASRDTKNNNQPVVNIYTLVYLGFIRNLIDLLLTI